MPAKPTPKTRKKVAPRNGVTKEFERLLQEAPKATHYVLRLFITGTTPRSVTAIANIRALCEQYLSGHFELEVVDIYQQPAEAQGEQIIAAPTLVREMPLPSRRMVGDLSDAKRVLVGLNLLPAGQTAETAVETKWIKL